MARQVVIETDEATRRSLKIIAAHSGETMKAALARIVAEAVKKARLS